MVDEDGTIASAATSGACGRRGTWVKCYVLFYASKKGVMDAREHR